MNLPLLLLAAACVADRSAGAVSDDAFGQIALRAPTSIPNLPSKSSGVQRPEGRRPLAAFLQVVTNARSPVSTGLVLGGCLQLLVVVVAMVFCCEGTADDAVLERSRRDVDASQARATSKMQPQRTSPPMRTAYNSRSMAGGPLQGPTPNPPSQPLLRGTDKPGWSTPEPEPASPASTGSLDGHSLPLSLKETVLCPALAELARGRPGQAGGVSLVLSAELGSQPQDGWIAVSDASSGDVVAKAYASESGPEPGVLLDADRGGYFAFLDTSSLYEQSPQVNRRILLRRASMSSLPAAPYAVMFLNTGAQSKTLVARRGWAAGEPLLTVNMDATGRVSDVADGLGRRIAECEQQQSSGPASQPGTGPMSPSAADRMPASGGLGLAGPAPGGVSRLVMTVESGADVGLVLCAILAAQKLR